MYQVKYVTSVDGETTEEAFEVFKQTEHYNPETKYVLISDLEWGDFEVYKVIGEC